MGQQDIPLRNVPIDRFDLPEQIQAMPDQAGQIGGEG